MWQTHHILPNEDQLFPAPPEGFIPKKMALLEVESKNLDEIHQPRVGGFTPSNFPVFSWSKYQHTHVHIISIFMCTSGLSQEAMIVKNIFSFTSSSCNPLHSNSCNYCFHMNHYVLPTLQPHSPKNIWVDSKNTCYHRPFLQIKLQASCRTFLHVYFVNLTCSNFISQGTHVQLSPGGQGESDVPFCGEAPCYGWLLCGSALLRHRSACERFSLDAELPLNSLLIAVTLCTHVHCWSCGWEANLAPAPCKPCTASFSRPLQSTWAFPQASQAWGQTHIPSF